MKLNEIFTILVRTPFLCLSRDLINCIPERKLAGEENNHNYVYMVLTNINEYIIYILINMRNYYEEMQLLWGDVGVFVLAE